MGDDDSVAQLLADLEAERQVLLSALNGLGPDLWNRESPAIGWLLRDCVVHLAETDSSAADIAAGVSRNRPEARQPRTPADGVLTPSQLAARARPPAEILEAYQTAGDRILASLSRYQAGDRLTWAGRPMSVLSFTTARLMEHWSHGLDILDAAGIEARDTERLRHVALLGYLTRDFAYRTHGLEPPRTPLHLELTSPSGQIWVWGPPGAPDRISGAAGDFCRVVTQRIHWSDTHLRTEGPRAKEFLTVAQAFAGPPGSGRPPKAAG